MKAGRLCKGLVTAVLLLAGGAGRAQTAPAGFQLAAFEADVTPPVGHPLCGGMVAPAARIQDPLSARGVVLRGGSRPVVVLALDWTELRNEAYDLWRRRLAEAAGTSPRHVLLSCVHVHDAPYADLDAQRRLDAVGLQGFHVDPAFHEKALQAVVDALRKAPSRRITHVGAGAAEVERIASNRRVVAPDGKASFKRYSRTADPAVRNAPEGLIDPWLRTVGFWDGDVPVAALSTYAVHPMSYYGKGGVSADFPGMARAARQAETPGVFQIYTSGCAGDVTAAKFNGGNDAARRELAERLRAAMAKAWDAQTRVPLAKAVVTVGEVRFALPATGPQSVAEMERTLPDPKADKQARLMAALGLSWAARVGRGQPVEVPALDLGPAQVVVLPAEAFVAFQLQAQKARPDQAVLALGYGECGPGYIPTEAARAEGYVEEHGYSWVAAGAEAALNKAVADALGAR